MNDNNKIDENISDIPETEEAADNTAPAAEEAGETPAPEAPPEEAPQEKKQKKPKTKKEKVTKEDKKRTKQVVRIEEIRKRLEETGEDGLDADTVISMYMPQRRARLLGAALLRLGWLRVFLIAAAFLILILFIFSLMQEKMGNFTINLDRLELYRKGISISEEGNFQKPTARLTAGPVSNATNITSSDIPSDIDTVDGDHNGENYVAYTYYLRNAGKEDVSYAASIKIESCAKGVEKASRVAVWKNGEKIVYAAPAANGEPEEGCVSFLSDTVVCVYTEEEFLVGNVDKYTVVIWLEGEDPECVDSIVGGSIQFSMNVYSDDNNDDSVFKLLIQDIIDAFTGDKPISAAGTESPEFNKYDDVTWDTRRNQ